MLQNEFNKQVLDNKSPWQLVVAFLLITVGGILLLSPLLGLGTAKLLTGLPFSELQTFLSNPQRYPEYKVAYLMVQATSSGFTFIAVALLFHYTFFEGHPFHVFGYENVRLTSIAFIFPIFLSAMIVNAVFIQWNQNVTFPPFMSGFENWAREMEATMEGIIAFMSTFDSFGYFLLAVLVIAILPSIGEELLFRGFMQNIFVRTIGNHHFAIMLTSIIFSAIHMQFFGFVPRLLLGLLLGYVYFYSKNLWYPILGHFINNFTSLLLLYLHQAGHLEYDVQSEHLPPISSILVFALVLFISLVFYKKRLENEQASVATQDD